MTELNNREIPKVNINLRSAGGGMKVNYSGDNNGISLYGILEGAWALPIILRGIHEKPWQHDPLDGLDHEHPITQSWVQLGLLEPEFCITSEDIKKVDNYRLTDSGRNVVLCSDLFEYEYSMIKQQMKGDFQTKPEKYEQLRRGLEAYSDCYLNQIACFMEQFVNSDDRIVDLCGGTGYYLKFLLGQNPLATGILFDKAPAAKHLEDEFVNRFAVLKGDALSDHPLYEAEAQNCDMVIMSEILHCLSKKDQLVLLEKAYKLLDEGGMLMAVEQHANMRLDLRLKDMTKAGKTLDRNEVTALIAGETDFIYIDGHTTNSHHINAFRKEA